MSSKRRISRMLKKPAVRAGILMILVILGNIFYKVFSALNLDKDEPEAKVSPGRHLAKREPGSGPDPAREEGAYHGFHAVSETRDGKPIVKVLLLTNPRSGSSYTGELLTSRGDAIYMFEPLYVWRKFLGAGADPRYEADSAKVLGDLLDCRPEVLRRWRMLSVFRKRPRGARHFCRDAQLRVVKTIRAKAHFVKPWIINRPDIKVVHLVRDPRGVMNSLKNGGNLWTDNNRNASLLCDAINKNIQLEDLGPTRYLRVRYEDLVDHPEEETRRIYSFMGVNVDAKVMAYLKRHTGREDPQGVDQRYLNTYRDVSFRHDHWKAKLNPDVRQHVEDVCSDVMQKLNYQPVLVTIWPHKR
nr:carbohydrate sulfotransferase 1-like [Procambarus clarkii]XP_045592685.1 carbohydrate sulfotransferase 1-like [Procambarus clarkii]